MYIFKNRTKLSTIILASILSLSACSDDDSNSVAPSTSEEHEHHATEEHSSAADEHSHHATESGDHKSESSGLTLGDENIKDGIIFLQDTTINGVLTVNASTPGATVLKNVKVTGNLLIKRSGRVDFSGSADVVHVGSSNTDVYAFEDNAKVNGHHFMGKNNTFTTKRFSDYQKVDWTEKAAHLSTGIHFAYTVTGDEKGAPVILIHGLVDGRVSWSQVAPQLAKKGYRVYVPELRGNGKTDKPIEESAYSIKELAKDIAAFIDKLELNKPHIVGHSFGSFVAQELSISYADKIGSITLIGSAASVDKKNATIDWLLNGTDDKLFDGVYAYDSTQKLPDTFYEKWGNSTNPDKDFQTAHLEHLHQVPYYAWKFLVKNFVAVDNAKRLSSISSNVQIIWGSKDAIFDKKSQETLQKGLDKAISIEFHEIKDADHNTHLGSKAAVETVTDYIDNFIKGVK
ncbi:alpha/beta fold hydrolase [Fibrobacter sp. UWB11]|uniref:alpha/beta fold hydrolase n=1 Tax=Fibrobacter sp. UWB11 TaxID=1896202 RepID=UPI0009259517|nr:alpha/beta hydrolase [Fibrobacter sp. UWB11]SIN91557.1 Pimeloyl-ACP methyl ester carboxylesterase [Fibrobacter sp. UWB11]